jgi:hypothetical protein
VASAWLLLTAVKNFTPARSLSLSLTPSCSSPLLPTPPHSSLLLLTSPCSCPLLSAPLYSSALLLAPLLSCSLLLASSCFVQLIQATAKKSCRKSRSRIVIPMRIRALNLRYLIGNTKTMMSLLRKLHQMPICQMIHFSSLLLSGVICSASLGWHIVYSFPSALW